MVFVTEDWTAFESYAENCRVGTYQTRDHVDGKELRVRTGKLGYVKVFNLADANSKADYERILRFCKLRAFVEIAYTMQEEVFHT